jgi:hypothetical protein
VLRVAVVFAALVAPLANGCGACDGRETAPIEVPPVEPEPPPVPVPAIEPVVVDVPLDEGRTYALHRFRFDLARTRIDVEDLAFQSPLRSALERRRATLAVNGGFWDTERQPEGLTIDGERRIGELSASIGGGLLVVDGGRARILDVTAPGFEPVTHADLALQCMPRLVADGAVIARNTRRPADRTAICLRDEGRTLDVYVARTDDPMGHGGPSLFQLATKLREEGCEDALNLDGGGSTGVAWFAPGDRVRDLPPRTDLRVVLFFHVEDEEEEEEEEAN